MAILLGELFLPSFQPFFAEFFNLPYFLFFFSTRVLVYLTNLIFLLLDNFTNNDRTPPHIDTYLQLFPNFGKYEIMEKTLSDKNEPNRIYVSYDAGLNEAESPMITWGFRYWDRICSTWEAYL